MTDKLIPAPIPKVVIHPEWTNPKRWELRTTLEGVLTEIHVANEDLARKYLSLNE
jgi:hypothetical protein